MFGDALQERTPGPSFYYVMLAATCFRRTAHSCHSNAGTLREIGRKYLTKAGDGIGDEHVSEYLLAQIRRAGVKASRRQPCTLD
jgi:hypothetical protein